ncbi:MAG: aminotransferase class I/II-fold pyridoxal phosphate-dependent enzyme [Oscillospiraceae bacterium]
MIQDFFAVSPALQAKDELVMKKIAPRFAEIDAVMEDNQYKMLRAFTDCRVAANHLMGSTGYGYDDVGRAKLEQVFARLTGSEAALFRHNFMSGTHALAVALFGLLRPGNTMLCATGRPYDTLIGVLGIEGSAKGQGSLAEFGVGYRQLELTPGGPDLAGIAALAPECSMLYLQRSRGYAARPALTLAQIQAASQAAKAANPEIVVVVDNCYGEFTQTREPTQCGTDVIVGSLIKNPGGGIAPTGGYIAGRADLVEKCACRLTAPGVGGEIGCTGDMLRQLYLGLYFAPGVTAQALKTSVYASALFEELGCEVAPAWQAPRNDIITSIVTGSPEKLVALCAGVQSASPVDSFVTPEPWPMPGYNCDIIMAAGAFTLGSSIELSCDAPMQPPYTAYMQGGLNFAAGRAGVLMAAQRAFGTGTAAE